MYKLKECLDELMQDFDRIYLDQLIFFVVIQQIEPATYQLIHDHNECV